MSTQVRSLLASGLSELRHEPTNKRIRAMLGGNTVIDTTRAMLVWEPRRIVPSYAVPASDIQGELIPEDAEGIRVPAEAGSRLAELSAGPVLDPSVPFAAHTADGQAAAVQAAGQHRTAAAFRLPDPELAGYVILDFGAFDAWYEEDELNVAHPRDPFKRIDVLPSSRHVRLELDGEVVADSSRPMLLFETLLPPRYYLRPDDVQAVLTPSDTRTFCAYKGQASYWSASIGGRTVPDLAWTYHEPLHDAARVRGLVAFFNEAVDMIVDGQHQQRPVTPWSSRMGKLAQGVGTASSG
jgi:uncharacterized protein (DUF427 family)